jgi:SIR2-like protein/SLOG family protein
LETIALDLGDGGRRIVEVGDFVAEFGAEVDTQGAALFVGAGASMAAGYPDWETLVAPYSAALRIESEDLPLVVQYYEDATPGGSERVRSDIIKMVRDTRAHPVETHRRLLGLPIPDVWTTNYDSLLEVAAGELGIPITVYAEDRDLATVRAAPRRLYKMHGTVDDNRVSAELVISRDDFDRYPTTHPRLWQLLRAHFVSRSVLFVGFSLTDPNISSIFRLARLTTPDVNHSHYAILSKVTESDEKRRMADLRMNDLARVGVHVVEIDNHAQLDTVLARLSARCRPPRAYLSGSIPAGDADLTRANAIADELAAELVRHADVRLMTGGELGARVGYAVSRVRHETGTYRPDDFVVIRRVKDDPVTAPNLRWGSIVFIGEDAALLRSEAFEQVRAIVVLGGAENTRQEIALAKDARMGVIAVGGTGGVAAEQWAVDMGDAAYRLGERPVDKNVLGRLSDGEPKVVARATVELLRLALYLE